MVKIVHKLNKITEDPARAALWLLILGGFGVVGLAWWHGMYKERTYWDELIVAAHGTLFEILTLGWLILWVTKRAEKRAEVRRCKDDVADLRRVRDPMTNPKIRRCVLSLNSHGISDITLSEFLLDEIDLRGARLQGANLEATVLERAHLEKVDLSRAVLARAYLQGALLTGAILEGANLEHADLDEAVLCDANLKGANLETANAVTANFQGAKYDDRTRLPVLLEGTIKRVMIYEPSSRLPPKRSLFIKLRTVLRLNGSQPPLV